MVFGSDKTAPIVFSAEKASLTIGDATAFATGVQVQFTRNVNQVPLLNGKKALSVGTPTGTMTANIIVANSTFAEKLNINSQCEVNTITIEGANGICNSGSYAISKDAANVIRLHNCLASAIQVSLQANEGVVIAGVTITFTAMEMS